MRVGIIGVGMTAFRPATPEYSWKELMFEAASRAYADAGVNPRTDVDSFITCAEDYYEGFGIFDEFVPDQLGAVLRPTCTVSGDGLHGLASAFMQIQAGVVDIVAVEAHSKASDIVSLEGILEQGLDPIWNRPLGAHPYAFAGLEADAYLRRTHTPAKALAAVVSKNRRNALLNPLASYGASVDEAQAAYAPERFRPLRALDISEPADGAVVLVVASERAGKRFHANPVWIRGIGWANDSPTLETRKFSQAWYAELAAQMAYRLAKVEVADVRTGRDAVQAIRF
jgi:acetyl-CoA C-acetyltransferase